MRLIFLRDCHALHTLLLGKMVRRITTNKVVEKQELQLTSYEKAVLRELVDVLEPFEEATDIFQGDMYNSISLANPSLLGLKKHSPLHSSCYLTHVCQFGSIFEDPLFICAAVLDHRFKLNWSTDEEKHIFFWKRLISYIKERNQTVALFLMKSRLLKRASYFYTW